MYDGENLAQVSDTFKVSDTYGAPKSKVFLHTKMAACFLIIHF